MAGHHRGGTSARAWRSLLCLTGLLVGASYDAGAEPLAWAVGANGTIVISSDGGAHWAPQASGTSADLLGVQFIDAARGFVVGAGGTMLRTTNGGATWSPVASGVSTALHDVLFSGPATGVAVGDGGNATRTLDGGANWQAFVFTASADFRALGSTEATTVLAVGVDRRFARSTDGGFTWSATAQTGTLPFPPLNWLGVAGAGGPSAVAVGADARGGAYVTWNGSAWSAPVYISSFSTTPGAPGFELFDVAFTGALVTVGKGGIVARSTNGGLTWSAPQSVAPFDLLDVEFLDALTGLAVGDGGRVIRTSDGGMTWSAPVAAAAVDLFALAVLDVPPALVAEPATPMNLALALAMLLVMRRSLRPA